MEHAPAIYALKRLHARLGAQILDSQAEAERLKTQILHVEAVIKMLDPTFNLRSIAPRRRNNRNFLYRKGDMVRAVLALLRDATEPMTATEITRALYVRNGIPEPTREQMRQMYAGVNSSLRNYRDKGVERLGDGSPWRWRLTS